MRVVTLRDVIHIRGGGQVCWGPFGHAWTKQCPLLPPVPGQCRHPCRRPQLVPEISRLEDVPDDKWQRDGR